MVREGDGVVFESWQHGKGVDGDGGVFEEWCYWNILECN